MRLPAGVRAALIILPNLNNSLLQLPVNPACRYQNSRLRMATTPICCSNGVSSGGREGFCSLQRTGTIANIRIDPMAKLQTFMSLFMIIGISPTAMKQLSKLLRILTNALSADSSVTETQDDKKQDDNHYHKPELLIVSEQLSSQLGQASSDCLRPSSLSSGMMGCLTGK